MLYYSCSTSIFSVASKDIRAKSSRALACSLWGFGAVGGLWSFSPQVWARGASPDPDPGPDPGPDLDSGTEEAHKPCPASETQTLPTCEPVSTHAADVSDGPNDDTSDGLSDKEAWPFLRSFPEPLPSEMALRLGTELPSETGLILTQDALSNGGGFSWPLLLLVGGGGLFALITVASGSEKDEEANNQATPDSMIPGNPENPENPGSSDTDGEPIEDNNQATPDPMISGNPGNPGPSDADDEPNDAPNDAPNVALNAAPIVVESGMAAALKTMSVDEGTPANWNIAAWFADPDGDSLTYTARLQKTGDTTSTVLPFWLTLDPETARLAIATRATDDAEVGVYTLTLTATDGPGATAVHASTLTVANVNDVPLVFSEAPSNLTVLEGAAASWDVSSWFLDEDGADEVLTYTTAAALPGAWLQLDEATGALTIAAEATNDGEVGVYTLTFTATDNAEAKAVHTTTLTLENVKDAPMVTPEAPSSLTAMENFTTGWNVSSWFEDEDIVDGAHETLVYTAAVLPDWLTLEAMTGALAPLPYAIGDIRRGVHTLAVTASDEAGATSVHPVTLTLVGPVHEPVLSAGLSDRILPAVGESLVLDLTRFFTDLQEDSSPTPAADLRFELSESIPDNTSDDNLVTAILTGVQLTLTPGTGASRGELWAQETLTLTALDTEAGRTTVTFTVTTRANVLDTSKFASAHGFIVQGDAADDRAGRSVSRAGDVNGDGLEDLIVGAWNGDDGGENAGEAYVFYGKAGTDTASPFGTEVQIGPDGTTVTDDTRLEGSVVRHVLDTTRLAPNDGFVLQGDAAYDRLGFSVTGAGDVNGDGVDDLIVGAPVGGDGGPVAGEAYILYGKPGLDGTRTQFGVRVALRDDGGDVVTTTTLAEDAEIPANSVVRRVVDTSSLVPADGFIVQGDRASDQFGTSVAGAGDINGDGVDDLVIGAYRGDDGGTDAGEAYVLYGKLSPSDPGIQAGAQAGTQFGTTMDGRQIVDTTELTSAEGFILRGDATEDLLGGSLASAGDINGDGLSDLVLGASQGEASGEDSEHNAGEAYIVYGKAGLDGTPFGTQFGTEADDGRRVLDLTHLTPAEGFILRGDAAEDGLGSAVAGVGDINGDGLDDLVVGASQGDDGELDAGEAYVIYGKAPRSESSDSGDNVQNEGLQFGMTVGTHQILDVATLSSDDGFILQGEARRDQLGYSVAGAGDINGDGLADLIVGAYQGDDGGANAGAAYVIYGKAGLGGSQFGEAVTISVSLDTTTDPTEPVAITTTITDGSAPEGSVVRQVLDVAHLAPTDGFMVQGDATDDTLGVSVSGAGDVNGDGFDDLIIGAEQGDDGGDNAGEAYVIYGGTHLGEVVSHSQIRTGVADESVLLGGAGHDRLAAHADTEALYGGAGDDTLALADASFRRANGGSGVDTLELGSGVELDLTDPAVRGRLRGVEVLSLTDTTAAVTLDLMSAYALTDARDNGGELTDTGELLLRLEGVSGMVVLADAASWALEQADAEGTADLHAQGSVRLLIDDGLL